MVDFAELLLRAYELLVRNQPLREHYQARFRHILVDEFQDTNILQYKWLKLLAGLGTADPSAIFAVGDDDQSIYAFRGANVGNMAEFEREFRVQNVVKLEQNYRSHGHILDSANALIRHNGQRLGKNLWTDAGAGEPVRVYESLSDGQEAQWLVDEVKSLVREGFDRSDIAVLYRSNAQSRVIEHALFSAAIPYRVYGGLRFFERQEVKHALAYLRLVANPDDDTSFVARGQRAGPRHRCADGRGAAGRSAQRRYVAGFVVSWLVVLESVVPGSIVPGINVPGSNVAGSIVPASRVLGSIVALRGGLAPRLEDIGRGRDQDRRFRQADRAAALRDPGDAAVGDDRARQP